MRGPKLSSMVIRLPDGTLSPETWPTRKAGVLPWYRKTPFVRGLFNMADTLTVGYRCLMKSAEKAGETEKPDRLDLWLERKFGEKASAVIGTAATVLGAVLAVLLFVALPTVIVTSLRKVIPSRTLLSVIEGLIKVLILVGYLFLCSRVPDMHRVFMYHGAEHKSIACYEAMEELTVENARPQCRFHPRCGTNFLFLVVLVSVLIGSFISWENAVLRVLIKLLLIPVVVGVSYELIRLAGRSDSLFTRIISAPGLWLQRITTQEPDDGMLETAIAALKLVIPADPADDRL